jgi:hypothetical protein
MPPRRLLSASLALALAGCATGDGVYWAPTRNSLYSSQSLGYVQAQGPTPLLVIGTPFPAAPMEPFARVVAATMSGANSGPPLTFTVDPPAPREADYRVVVAFGTPYVGAQDLCSVQAPVLAPTGPRVHAEAAFCVETKRITEIKGDMLAEATGPDDPAFASFLRGLTLNLMPPVSRLPTRGCRTTPGC